MNSIPKGDQQRVIQILQDSIFKTTAWFCLQSVGWGREKKPNLNYSTESINTHESPSLHGFSGNMLITYVPIKRFTLKTKATSTHQLWSQQTRLHLPTLLHTTPIGMAICIPDKNSSRKRTTDLMVPASSIKTAAPRSSATESIGVEAHPKARGLRRWLRIKNSGFA